MRPFNGSTLDLSLLFFYFFHFGGFAGSQPPVPVNLNFANSNRIKSTSLCPI